MRYFTDSILLLLYSTLTFFYVPADQALVFALLFAVILCCITYLGRVCKTESCSHNSLPVLKPAGNIIPVLAGSYVIFGLCSLWFSDLLLLYDHGKQAQHVHGFCQRVGNTVDIPGTHGGTEQNYRNRKYCDK